MKTILRAFAGIMAAFALAGCPETNIGPDFGYKPLVLKPSEWNGIWKVFNDEDAFKFRVSDAENGRITITEVPGRKAKKGAGAKPMVMTLRLASTKKEDGLYFVTIVDKGDASQTLTPGLVRRLDNNSFVFWTVNNDAVAEAIKTGKLKGKVKPDKDGAHSHLDSDPANYSLLVQPRFWTWMNPTMLGRSGK
ncbi:MAG: hypothetical protein WCH98_02315 [Verrucomicrobiota bacterium]